MLNVISLEAVTHRVDLEQTIKKIFMFTKQFLAVWGNQCTSNEDIPGIPHGVHVITLFVSFAINLWKRVQHLKIDYVLYFPRNHAEDAKATNGFALQLRIFRSNSTTYLQARLNKITILQNVAVGPGECHCWSRIDLHQLYTSILFDKKLLVHKAIIIPVMNESFGNLSVKE